LIYKYNENNNKGNELSKNNYKYNINCLQSPFFNYKNFNTIGHINYSDRLIYNNIMKNKNKNKISINDSTNTINKGNKKLVILKNGIIYWLRKLYIILPENIFNINYSRYLYIYFYYPIKDINMKIKNRYFFREKGTEEGGEIFCKTLDNIFEEVKFYLKFPNFFESFKMDLYNEDYTLIKNDSQLMEKKDKYKILYIKITKLSDEQINKKLNRCQFHNHNKKNNDINKNALNIPLQLFTNKELKNKIFVDSLTITSINNSHSMNKRNSCQNLDKNENNKNANNNNNQKENLDLNNKTLDNYKSINRIKNFLEDERNKSSIFNHKTNHYKNKTFNRNKTDYKDFPKIFIKKFKNDYLNEKIQSKAIIQIQKPNNQDFQKKINIPKIKSKGLWNSNIDINYQNNRVFYNSLNNKWSQRIVNLNNRSLDDSKNMNDDSDNYIYSLSIDQSHSNNEDIYDKVQRNNHIKKDNRIINLKPSINNINENENIYKKTLKQKLIVKESITEKDPCDEVFNLNYKNISEYKDKKSPIKKYKYINKSNSFIYNNRYKQFNSIIEINQIQFIALNTCIRNFVAEKINIYITDEDIQKIYNKEQILNNISEINNSIPINIYLKEFLFYAYLSNYISKNYPQLCNDFYKELKDYYININNILSINKFKEFINGVKIVFHEMKNNKNTMMQLLTENYTKNNKKLSFVFFMLFMIYNKKNLSTLFDKEILFTIFECIDIHYYNEINVEQFIKFKIFFVKNKWINNDMKKMFITNFFKYTIIDNKNFNMDLFIIKLRPIIKLNTEKIKKYVEKNLSINNINDIYDKFIEYFNF
jgi:hypothetical protein